MPIYEYVCEKCQTKFEKYIPRIMVHKLREGCISNEEFLDLKTFADKHMSEEEQYDIQCPQCQSQEIRKQMSIFSTTGLDHNVG